METSFAGSPSCLAELRRAIRHSLAKMPGAIPDEVVDDLVLAVSEAATNAILYGSVVDELRLAKARPGTLVTLRRRIGDPAVGGMPDGPVAGNRYRPPPRG